MVQNVISFRKGKQVKAVATGSIQSPRNAIWANGTVTGFRTP